MIFDYIDNGVGDGMGYGVIEGDAYLRKILPASVDDAIKLLDSGLIDKLSTENIFPITKISSKNEGDQSLLISHELHHAVVHPGYWSPEMLRSAGLLVLRVNEIAGMYGYELTDIHPFNIIFRGVNPMFVDFGSFRKIRNDLKWSAHNQFLRCYIYPLTIFSYGLDDYYFRIYKINGTGISDKEIMLLRYPVLRYLKPKSLKRFVRVVNKIHHIKISLRNWLSYRLSPAEKKNNNVGRNNKQEMSRLCSRLNGIKWPSHTRWGDYHTQFYDEQGGIRNTPRFETIVSYVKKIQPRVVVEVAANQGVLSKLLCEVDSIEIIFSSDYDVNAIDMNFLHSKEEKKKYPYVWNFMNEPNGVRLHNLSTDLVVALAVVHHLVLTQGFTFSAVFKKLLSFTTRYAIVEFMPLGLWDGQNSPVIPGWYNVKEFEKAFLEFVNILDVEKLEENRIVYLVELQDA